LSHPSIHIVIERRFDHDVDHHVDGDVDDVRAEIAGPHRAKFARRLDGHGQVFGIKFRPAMFRAWWGSSTEALTDNAVPLSRLPRVDVDALMAAASSSLPFATQLADVDALLRAALPVQDPHDIAIRDLVEAAAVDVDLVRLDDLVARSGLPLRTLQRRFKASVGVSAKWVLQRYRLHEAAEALRASTPPTLADLAARLGYADQAHFARDFKATIGVSPGHWR
ncbi:MAG TPA: helix-turn-helix domain-containing protein, partial [Myxococcota bacterium]